MCGLEDNVRKKKLKGVGLTHKDIRYRKKDHRGSNKEAALEHRWGAGFRKEEGVFFFFFFFNPSYHRKEREKCHMDAGLDIF